MSVNINNRKENNLAPKVSIIVPVYNIREFLPRCIESLVSQTLREIEIILIDDGSTDGSGEDCNRLAEMDERISVIHQDNGGLSAARNTGIRAARGEYILFVDSDDYIKRESCGKLYEAAINLDCEIVAADSIKVIGDKESPDLVRNQPVRSVCSGEDFLVESIKSHHISLCAPFALYQRKLIVENNHYFKPGILHEDELWTPQMYLLAGRVTYVDYAFYYHYFREGSITHSKNKEKNSRDLVNTCNELYERYKTLKPESRKYLNDYLCMLYLSALYVGNNSSGNRRFALKTAYSMRNRMKAVLYAVSPALYLKINKTTKESEG